MSILGAFIVPHPPIIAEEVGRGEEVKINQTVEAYKEVAKEIKALKPDTIILTSPHTIMYEDYFHLSPGHEAEGDLSQFRAPEVSIKVKYDMELVMTISRLAEDKGFPAGTLGERNPELDHGTLIPLYFINKEYQNYQLVRIGLSGLSLLAHYEFGKIIQEAIELVDKRVVVIASGDLSHKLKVDGPYGYAEEGPLLDKEIVRIMKKADFLSLLKLEPDFCEAAGECGIRSFEIMAGALNGLAVTPHFLSYEGPFGVGYAIGSFKVIGKDKNRELDKVYLEEEKKKIDAIKSTEDAYVQMARKSLETYILTGKKLILPKDCVKELIENKAGVFVSLKKEGRLRGCIGTISPVYSSIAEEIIQNAISAGTQDPRFSPVTINELPELIYSVDVLGQPESIQDESQLDVKKYGVIVTSGRKRGLLLPNLEGIHSVSEQVEIAKQKAGIDLDEVYSLMRFEVVRHH